MHRDYDHDHGDHQSYYQVDHSPDGSRRSGGHEGSSPADLSNGKPRKSRGVTQWQMPHLGPQEAEQHEREHQESDLDQVEAAFVEGFMTSSDPTSFLRLANIPLTAMAADGAKLALLRVETDLVADIGSLTPHLGGQSFRYDPLPRSLVSHRRRLRFVYFDGLTLRALSFAHLRELAKE